MKVFINVETEGKNNEELTAELVMVKSFVVKKITDMFPSIDVKKDVIFISPLREIEGLVDCKHFQLANHAGLLLMLADCDLLINAPQTGYRRRNGSSAITCAAADFGIPVVDLGLKDYGDANKGMRIVQIDYRSVTRYGIRRSRNIVYSNCDHDMNYEEEE